jgi:hypothetical protein
MRPRQQQAILMVLKSAADFVLYSVSKNRLFSSPFQRYWGGVCMLTGQHGILRRTPIAFFQPAAALGQ